MQEFSGEDDLTAALAEDGKPGRLGTRINFQPQAMHLGLFFQRFQDDTEGKATIDGCLSLPQQDARPARMDWVQRMFVRVHYEDLRHFSFLCALAGLLLRG